MKIFKIIALYIFDLLDKFYHQKRINKFIKKNLNVETFLDVGAHLGSYTDLIYKNNPKSKIFMFEPQKKIFLKLKKKYLYRKNITDYNFALSNKGGTTKLYINKHNVASTISKINFDDDYLKHRAKLFGESSKSMIERIEKIKRMTLFDFIENKRIKKIDLIKIDTEGHELEVLKGLKNKLKIVNSILIEFQFNTVFLDYDANKIHKYLKKNDLVLKKRFHFPFTSWEDRIYVRK